MIKKILLLLSLFTIVPHVSASQEASSGLEVLCNLSNRIITKLGYDNPFGTKDYLKIAAGCALFYYVFLKRTSYEECKRLYTPERIEELAQEGYHIGIDPGTGNHAMVWSKCGYVSVIIKGWYTGYREVWFNRGRAHQ